MKQIQFFIALLLSPLTIWYAAAIALRNLLFSMHILRSQRPALRTIGIGNLRMGGTGKTPHTELLIRHCLSRGLNTALLSRGYGRKTKGFMLASTGSLAADIGDEPCMMARKFHGITVAVSEKRADGLAQLAQQPVPPDIVLLDDVYQHRSIKPGIMILLTEYKDLYSDDFILPFGNLREFRSGSHRADIVIVTKCPPAMSLRKRNECRRRLHLRQSQQLFFTRIQYLKPIPLFGNRQWEQCHEVLLVTGIANPAPLRHHLERHSTVVHLPFPDHHSFSADDCRLIIRRFQAIHEPSKAIITTEKDAMRLLTTPCAALLSQMPLFYIPIEVTFVDDEKSFFHSIQIP